MCTHEPNQGTNPSNRGQGGVLYATFDTAKLSKILYLIKQHCSKRFQWWCHNMHDLQVWQSIGNHILKFPSHRHGNIVIVMPGRRSLHRLPQRTGKSGTKESTMVRFTIKEITSISQ